MKLAIFGGMFDPPHFGHLTLAERTLSILKADRMLFVPAASHPMKSEVGHSNAQDRFAMTSLAVKDHPLFSVSDIEINRPGVSYTVDTLEEIRKQYNPETIFLCIGADNAASFHKWHRPERIVELCNIVVWKRSSDLVITSLFTDQMIMLDTPLIDVSSTQIRQLVHSGKSIEGLVPDAVREYIVEHSLYR
ncbi:MAG TPA: nicotinate (nicotinamide) nucleotide adenylyltransferase [Candidatus Kapabacteria bacterium]|nr:nicotinate (nicotinamide) nucleotide adenylyltransferase [Candidatus Kapabacteria bacterium]